MTHKEKPKDDAHINLRIPSSLKEKILERARAAHMTTSAYLRDFLDQHHSEEATADKVREENRLRFLESFEFSRLIIWVYSKRNTRNTRIENADEILEIIRTIKKTDELFPEKWQRNSTRF